jgi:hypothetical protein
MAKIDFITLAKTGEPKEFSRLLDNGTEFGITLRKANDTDLEAASHRADELCVRYIQGGFRRTDGVWSTVPDILDQPAGVTITPSRPLFFKCLLLEIIQCQPEKYTWFEIAILAAVDGNTFEWLNECMNSFFLEESGE